MALKKSELYSSLWQSCDALRGGMDASQYKDYVLVLLFIKYVSDKYAGKPYLLKLMEVDAAPSVELRHRTLVLSMRPHTDTVVKEALLSRWYRDQVRARAAGLAAEWSRTLGVNAPRVYVQHMKTKWGGCSPARRSIRLNSELAKKPPGCLEYIVVQ